MRNSYYFGAKGKWWFRLGVAAGIAIGWWIQ